MPIIECKNLTMAYGSHIALRDLSFAIEAGDYLCIVGENGSGKSTLIKGLLGLQQPKEGKIILNGITHREIGYLPQQSMAQKDFPASVKEVVLSGCLSYKHRTPFYSADDKIKAAAALEKMGISDLEKRSFRALSGGQRQRVLMARALCAADRMLLLDEPAAALDPQASAELYALIGDLNKKEKMTIIMVSHDLDAAGKADKILHMANGCAYFGSTEQYYHSDVCHHLTGGGHHHHA
ncbi:MAG: metal ABC transporter ATP-binding protein [Oscillospiraceae bacterium]|nr:metal ABC transporter ATP-binding protein [Oscillospiraceae bacterium]